MSGRVLEQPFPALTSPAPAADCLRFYPVLPLRVRAAIMQSCNQGAELAAHLGLIRDGCEAVPARRREGRKKGKSLGILSGFFQLS